MKTKKNPVLGRRRRKALPSLRELAQQHACRSLKKLVELIDSKNERVALSAAQTVLDRAHGKVGQSTDLKTPQGGLTVNIVRFKPEGDSDAERV